MDSRMRRYIRGYLLRQIYSISIMLFSSSQIRTMLNRHRPCLCLRFSSLLFGILFESRFPSNCHSIFEFFVLVCVSRCFSVPMAGSLSKCAGFTRSRETVSTLPLTRIFMTPHDNLIRAVVRGGQRLCNCDSSQKYM